MTEHNIGFRDNVFTQLGFESVDEVIVSALKKGSKRDGSPHVDITLPSAVIVEVPTEDKEAIAKIVDSSNSTTVDLSTNLVLQTLYKTVQRGKIIEGQIGI